MARTIFPSGVFKQVEHFGSGRGQIKVTKLTNGRVLLKRFRTTYNVSEEFFLERMSKAVGYRDTGAFFKGFYWGTQEGIEEKDEQYQTNFNRAVRNKYGDASNKIQEYAKYMFKELGMDGRDDFTKMYPEDIEEVFQYEEQNAREWSEYGHVRDIAQGNADINTLINDLESMFTEERVQEMRKKFNYGYYQKRYGMS